MAYNEILIAIALPIVMWISYIIGLKEGKKEIQVKDYQDGYKEGFNDAKKFYHEDPKKEREEEQQRLMEQIREANTQPPRLTAEVLMAYGVESSSHLPENIKALYGLKNGQPAVDLDYLINEEVTENDRY